MPINNFFMFIKSLCADSPSKKHITESKPRVFQEHLVALTAALEAKDQFP